MTKFAEFFKTFQKYTNDYVIIGGNAASILMEEQYVEFRKTKDYDIVVIFENIKDDNFSSVFMNYIDSNGYDHYYRGEEKNHQYYRFQNPDNLDCPNMIEVFSKKPIFYGLAKENNKTPIHTEKGPSLSAIVLNKDYYELIKSQKKIINEDGYKISTVNIPCIIYLKARAHLDIQTRMKNKEKIKHHADKTKHRNDILRLLPYIQEKSINTNNIPKSVRKDLRDFIKVLEKDDNFNVHLLKQLDVLNYISIDNVLKLLNKMC